MRIEKYPRDTLRYSRISNKINVVLCSRCFQESRIFFCLSQAKMAICFFLFLYLVIRLLPAFRNHAHSFDLSAVSCWSTVFTRKAKPHAMASEIPSLGQGRKHCQDLPPTPQRKTRQKSAGPYKAQGGCFRTLRTIQGCLRHIFVCLQKHLYFDNHRHWDE